MQQILNLGKLVLPATRSVAYLIAYLARGRDYHWNKYDQNPREPATHLHNHNRSKQQSKDLLKKFSKNSGHGVLHALNIIDDGG